MAYWLEDLVPPHCETYKCEKRATVNLASKTNPSIRWLCKRCGEAMLREMLEQEARRVANAPAT